MISEKMICSAFSEVGSSGANRVQRASDLSFFIVSETNVREPDRRRLNDKLTIPPGFIRL